MFPFFSIIAVGFFLGLRHAADPDHVVAVAAIVSREGTLKRAALRGIFWGVGHTLTILLVGGAIVLFRLVIPARLGLGMELAVSVMLIALGLMNLPRFRRSLPETLPHRDRGSHVIQHLRPLIVGVFHGLAGSAAVALLVLAAIPDSFWSLAYLLLFGIGTMAGMLFITLSIASASKLVACRRRRFPHRLGIACSLASLVFGIFLAYKICFVHGLLTIHLEWIPR